MACWQAALGQTAVASALVFALGISPSRTKHGSGTKLHLLACFRTLKPSTAQLIQPR